MIEDEEFLFQQEMADVKPLQSAERVRLAAERVSAETVQLRRAAAVADTGDPNPPKLVPIPKILKFPIRPRGKDDET